MTSLTSLTTMTSQTRQTLNQVVMRHPERGRHGESERLFCFGLAQGSRVFRFTLCQLSPHFTAASFWRGILRRSSTSSVRLVSWSAARCERAYITAGSFWEGASATFE